MDAYDIFVSYSHQDRERVRTLVNALSAEGWRVFWDRTIPAGESWRSYIGAPLAAAPIVVVCWSKVSVESDWMSQEADAAAKRWVLLPVMFDEVTPPLGPSHDGYALGGGDILRYYGSPSEGACRADCESEGAACRAYTWVKPGGYKAGEPSVCYLMTSFRNPVRHACCVTATRGPFPTP